MTSPLFKPLTLPNGFILKNRLVKASMSEHLASAQGNPGATLNKLYRRFSEGGAGLLLSGNVMVDRRFLEGAGNVVVDEQSDRDALKAWAAAGQSAGSGFLLQISHPGRQTPAFVHTQPLAPSAVQAVKIMMAFAPPKAMTEEDINEVLEKFSKTAQIAESCGFSGVQLHGAHGYLISQFLSPRTNHRTDQWGGNLEGRARFLLELIRRVRQTTSPSFVLGLKLNVGDLFHGQQKVGELTTLGQWLAAEKLDFVEVSGGDYENPLLYGLGHQNTDRAYFLEEALTLSKSSGLPVMLTGGLRHQTAMESALNTGTAALIGLARPLAMNPEWPKQAAAGHSDDPDASSPPFPVDSLKILSETAWFGAQLERLSKGKDPDPSLDPWRPLLSYLGDGVLKGLLWQCKTRLL